jgi:hypothetical protein
MSKERRFKALGTSVILLSVVIGPVGALAEERRHSNARGYLSLGDTPQWPTKPAMTDDELAKLKNELSTKRDRQAPKGKSGVGAGRPGSPGLSF